MNSFIVIVFGSVLTTLVAVAMGSSVILNVVVYILGFSFIAFFLDRDSK